MYKLNSHTVLHFCYFFYALRPHSWLPFRSPLKSISHVFDKSFTFSACGHRLWRFIIFRKFQLLAPTAPGRVLPSLAAPGCGWPWPLLAVPGLPWSPQDAPGRSWPPLAAPRLPWPPLAVLGRPRSPLASAGRPCLPLWLTSAACLHLTALGRLWPPMAAFHFF